MELLDKLHEIEQRECRIISRKELNTHFPEDMDYTERRKVIQAWQNSYFARLNHVMKASLKSSIREAVRGLECPK